jgi:Putative motility protein
MDVSPTALVNAAVDMKQAQSVQAVQVSVLKKSLDLQTSAAAALLQATPANLPLASSGSVGTQVNRMV